MGILDAPFVNRLSVGDASSPVSKVGMVAWFDANSLSNMADGQAIAVLNDLSGSGHNLRQNTVAARPTKQSVNGKPVIRFVANTQLVNENAMIGWPHAGSVSAPITIFSVIKAGVTQSGTPMIIGGLAAGRIRQLLDAPTGTVIGLGGSSNTGTSGNTTMDNQFHIVMTTVETTGGHSSVDGYLVSTTTASLGTDQLKGLNMGASDTAGTLQYLGDIGESIVFGRRMTLKEQDSIVAYLGAKWGITVGKTEATATWEQTTSSNGQAIRIYTPSKPAASKTLVLWSHPHSHNEQIAPGYFAYAYAHVCKVNGWHFAASYMHGDQWGNSTAQADLLDLYNFMAARDTFDRVILIGASMGGLASANAIIKNTIAKAVGAYIIDGAVSLSAMFAGNVGTYSASIRAAYGIASDGSDYASKTSTWDPSTYSGSALPIKRWRFVASTTDVGVVQSANTDVFRPIAAVNGLESALVPHLGGHLIGGAASPADFVAFAKRCGA